MSLIGRFSGVPRGNELLIACNLENYTSAFLHHALIAFADFLLDKRTPGTEALRAFEEHSNQLLTETFNHKWLYSLRHFDLTEDDSSGKQFWTVQKETVENARREFENLLWKAELEEAASPVAGDGAWEGSGEIQPTQQLGATGQTGNESTGTEAGLTVNGTNPAESDGKGRKRGPKSDHEATSRVAEIVARVAPDGDWRPKLDEICEALDEAQIPFPRRWRKRDRSCDGWAAYDERANAIKAIEYRLEIAKQRKKTTPETLS